MGDPRKIRNKYSGPMHPWQKARLEAEAPLMKTYGLTSKKELWKVTSKVKKFKDTAKNLVAKRNAQAEKERKQLLDKLKSYGLIQSESMDELLGMTTEKLLDRRLQTLVMKKGLARTIKQARQMITHRHITVNGKKVTAPGYLVRVAEEASIQFYDNSAFKDNMHPERGTKEELAAKQVKKTEAPAAEEQPAAEPAAEAKE